MSLNEATTILEAFKTLDCLYREENPISVRVEWGGLLDIAPTCDVTAWPSKDHNEKRAVTMQAIHYSVPRSILEVVRQVEGMLATGPKCPKCGCQEVRTYHPLGGGFYRNVILACSKCHYDWRPEACSDAPEKQRED